MFARYDKQGNLIRYKSAVIDCSADPILTEQSHKAEVDINNIVKRHGGNLELIAKVNALRAVDMQFDDVTGNDFQEAMFKVAKAQESFDSLPSAIRKQFDNNPATFLDFVQNPDNAESLVEMGLAQRIPEPQPVQVAVVSQPDESSAEAPAV